MLKDFDEGIACLPIHDPIAFKVIDISRNAYFCLIYELATEPHGGFIDPLNTNWCPVNDSRTILKYKNERLIINRPFILVCCYH